MQRLYVALSACIGLVVGALLVTYLPQTQSGPTEADVRAMVAEIIADEVPVAVQGGISTPTVDAATIHPMIESYLLANPKILQRVSDALQVELRAEQRERTRAALLDMHDEIYNDPDQVVLGNPDGNVTLVEMFDYNCGYCRSSLPDLATLLAEDKDLRVVLKEFPILSKDSDDAARIAVAANKAGIDYWKFHEKLFTSRGKVDEAAAVKAAEELGLSPVSLRLDAASADTTAVLARSHQIAQAVGTSGTPTYIIGDEVIPGAIGVDALRAKIANVRACGSTVCDG